MVTSELTTSGGRPYLATAGISPLMLLSALVSFPAQAEYTDTVTSGMTVTGETVTDWNVQYVATAIRRASWGSVIDSDVMCRLFSGSGSLPGPDSHFKTGT